LSKLKSQYFIDYLTTVLAEEVQVYKDLKKQGRLKGRVPGSLP